MFIEELVANTIKYYLQNEICFLSKCYIPFQIIKTNKNYFNGKLLTKSYVDYYGLINQKYVAFETKQTEGDTFNLNQIKDHQIKHLNLINKLNGISFVLIHFFNFDKTFLVLNEYIQKWMNIKKNKITINYLESEIKKDNKAVFELIVLFPGILNLYEVVSQIIKNKTKLV